ncbi:hypothetical protein GCM10023189_15230 [Nibrella saemangeumensis]|uniref:General stress protein 17M-like domain-containing protein n=2 Tax=Nibrella saemangeumensis TaxID=1084526 RepID=A0ABP8ML58_9BACT
MMTAIFRDRESAEQAYDALLNHGFSKDDVNLVMSDDTRKRNFDNDSYRNDNSDLGDKAMEGAGKGSAIGGTLGAIAGAIAAIGTSLAIPGLGLVIAGPIAAGLAGAGAGGLTGGIIGALTGAGVPDDRAKEYESGIKEGGIVIGVEPRNEADVRYLEQHGFH